MLLLSKTRESYLIKSALIGEVIWKVIFDLHEISSKLKFIAYLYRENVTLSHEYRSYMHTEEGWEFYHSFRTRTTQLFVYAGQYRT